MSKQINLINPALRRKNDLVTATPLAVATLVMLIALNLVGAYVISQADARQYEADQAAAKLKAAQDQLVVLNQTLAGQKPDPELSEKLANAREMLKMREEVVTTLEKGSFSNDAGFTGYLRGFARQIPANLWLTSFTIAGGGGEMEIRGRMLKPDELPEYIRRLNTESVFQGHRFSSLEILRPEPSPDAVKAAAAKAGGKPTLPTASVFVDFALISVGGGVIQQTKPAAPKASIVSTSSLEAIPTASTPAETGKSGASIAAGKKS